MSLAVSTPTVSNVISINQPILTPKQEQEKWLGEAIQTVLEKSSNMKSLIRQRDFTQVLRFASQMLAELRTGMLAPQNYYELYVKVFDEMQYLEQYLEEEYQRGRGLEEMYEVVQHTGNIVPRLYLLITVGALYIKSGEQPAIEILRDLVEMCKGVQHPTRGLFLRHFLLTMMKNKLPGDSNRIIESNAETDGGTVEDTAELILQNFKEMNWLWIRMEAKGPANLEQQTTMQRKHKDRKELCVLVGMNIVRLSQLEGLDRQVYKNNILPRLLSIIVKYREAMAQQYLLEVIVQVFPDEFHLFTLDELLGTLENVSSSVDICVILTSLMERLGNYAVSLREGVMEVGSRKEEKLLYKMFDIFKSRLDTMINSRDKKSSSNKNNNNDTNNNNTTNGHHGHHSFSLLSYVESMSNLVRLAIKTDPTTAISQIGIVLISIAEKLTTPPREVVVRTIERMISYIITTLKDPCIILELDGLEVLTRKLPFSARRAVAIILCSTCVQSSSYCIPTFELAARLFEMIAPLVHDEPDAVPSLSSSSLQQRNNNNNNNNGEVAEIAEEFLEEQHLVCRVLHLLQCEDAAMQMKMLNGVRKQLGQGGPERIVVTLPTLASLYIRLALRLKKSQEQNRDENNNNNNNVDANGNETEADAEVVNNINNNNNNNKVLCAKAFHFIHSGDGKGILEVLTGAVPLQTFHLYLASAAAADVCGLPEASYEHYVAAFQIYEENAADTRDQIMMMKCIISSLHNLNGMPEENYELLATKVCQYSSKLMRKSDQSRVVALCAHLFWKNILSEESHRRVLECLQRSLKIADHTPPAQQLPLFVELLNQMLHYYAGKAPGVTLKYVSALIDLVQDASSKVNENETSDIHNTNSTNNNITTQEGNPGSENETYDSARTYYRNTARYIRSRQQVDERFQEIEI